MVMGDSVIESVAKPLQKLHVIIPAGGAGTRLWPLSRRAHPKFLLDLLGQGISLLQGTVLRLAPLAGSITIVTGADHGHAVTQQVEDLRRQGLLSEDLPLHLVMEPSGRDSMPAIGLATALIQKWYGKDSIVGSFAADHTIGDEDGFRDTIRRAIEAATRDYLVTVGITPVTASTGFGYIRPTKQEVSPGALLVQEFVEKPPASIARQYVADGYLWNAGMFIVRSEIMLNHLARLHPGMAASLSQIADLWSARQDKGSKGTEAAIDQLWNSVPRIAFDHALAEPVAAEGGVAVTPTKEDVGWSDVGDFTALSAPKEDSPERKSHRDVINWDSPQTAVFPLPGKVTAVIGVPNVIIVDTPDALLVAGEREAQRIKELTDEVKARGREDVL